MAGKSVKPRSFSGCGEPYRVKPQIACVMIFAEDKVVHMNRRLHTGF